MSTFFVFRFLKDWKQGDLPMNAFVSIGIADHSVLPTGESLISAQLATDKEVDYAVDGLIAELEKVRKDAKARIKEDNARVESSVRKRLDERNERH